MVRSDSKEQTVINFIIVTAVQLLNGTEPGEVLFPVSHWSLVPDNFGLDTPVLLSADLREGNVLWRFPGGSCLHSTCPQHGPACRQDKTHRAELSSGSKDGVQPKTMQKSPR